MSFQVHFFSNVRTYLGQIKSIGNKCVVALHRNVKPLQSLRELHAAFTERTDDLFILLDIWSLTIVISSRAERETQQTPISKSVESILPLSSI